MNARDRIRNRFACRTVITELAKSFSAAALWTGSGSVGNAARVAANESRESITAGIEVLLCAHEDWSV
jgi:hypothetical protein